MTIFRHKKDKRLYIMYFNRNKCGIYNTVEDFITGKSKKISGLQLKNYIPIATYNGIK